MKDKLSRREFIKNGTIVTLGSLGTFSLCQLSNIFGLENSKIIETDKTYWAAKANNAIECHVCHFNCLLNPNQIGICYSRKNHSGELFSHAYNNPCIISVDPIEKLPMHHYLPNSQTLSLAVGGCNSRCLYCQNWQESQSEPDKLKTFNLPPEEAVKSSKIKGCPTIVFTYTEPITYYEYVRDISVLAKQYNIKTLCASNLYINPSILKELCKSVTGFTAALKGFDEDFYQKVTGLQLKPILKSLEILKENNVYFEIVNLIVPTYNDDLVKIKAMCKWVQTTLGGDIPIHFGRFVPQHKLKNLTRTPVQTLEQARQIAIDEGIRYVYIFNLSPHDGNNTYCEKCKKILIKRLGFKILENNLINGTCKFCSQKIPGIWGI